jgi:ABC-type multidrug transport system permease subunit
MRKIIKSLLSRELRMLILIHFKELVREPGVIFWGVGFPILMAWGLGITFTRTPELRKDIAIINSGSDSKLYKFLNANTEAAWTADSLRSFNLSINDEVFGNNTFRFIPQARERAEEGVKRGRYSVIIESSIDSIFFRLDPANPDARLIQLQLSGLFDDTNTELKLTRSRIIPMELQGTRYVDFLVPGLLALSIMMACMWGISYTIIERRKGNMLRRMVATPMSKYNLLVAHMISRLTVNFVEAGILVLFAWLYFGIYIQGSIMALFLLFLAGNLAFTGLAVLLSSRTSKTEVGNAMINFFVMPMMILSGIFFSYQNFPEWSIPVIQKFPLTMMADGFRSIINEGAGLIAVAEEITLLSSLGIVSLILGIRIFKWY